MTLEIELESGKLRERHWRKLSWVSTEVAHEIKDRREIATKINEAFGVFIFVT